MLVKKGRMIYEVRYELWFCGKNASFCNESSKGKWNVIILHKFLLKQEGWNFVQNSLSLKYTVMVSDYQTLIIQNLFFLKSCWIYIMYSKERHLFQFDYFQKSLNFLRVSYFMTMTVFLETFSFCNALWYLIAKEIECNKQESLKFHATKSIVKMINKQTLLIGPYNLKF